MAIMNFDLGLFGTASKKAVKVAPASWLETLRQSDADIAAGRVVPVDDVLSELDEIIASMEVRSSPHP